MQFADQTFQKLPELFQKVSNLSNRCIYEFGVHQGESLHTILKLCKTYNIEYSKIFGFDSFKGLPLETNDRFNHKSWYPGRFDLRKLYGHPSKAAAAIKKELVLKTKVPQENLNVIAVWFENLKFDNNMTLASFVNIDCDQYTSTMQVFAFLFENNLLDTDTIIRFDDWGGTPEYQGGESKALVDSCKKYNFKFKILHKHIISKVHVKVLVQLVK